MISPKVIRLQTIKNEKSIKIVLTQKWCNYNVNMYCLRQRAYLYKLLSSNITRRNGNVLREFKNDAKSKRIYTGRTCNKAECRKTNSKQMGERSFP